MPPREGDAFPLASDEDGSPSPVGQGPQVDPSVVVVNNAQSDQELPESPSPRQLAPLPEGGTAANSAAPSPVLGAVDGQIVGGWNNILLAAKNEGQLGRRVQFDDPSDGSDVDEAESPWMNPLLDPPQSSQKPVGLEVEEDQLSETDTSTEVSPEASPRSSSDDSSDTEIPHLGHQQNLSAQIHANQAFQLQMLEALMEDLPDELPASPVLSPAPSPSPEPELTPAAEPAANVPAQQQGPQPSAGAPGASPSQASLVPPSPRLEPAPAGKPLDDAEEAQTIDLREFLEEGPVDIAVKQSGHEEPRQLLGPFGLGVDSGAPLPMTLTTMAKGVVKDIFEADAPRDGTTYDSDLPWPENQEEPGPKKINPDQNPFHFGAQQRLLGNQDRVKKPKQEAVVPTKWSQLTRNIRKTWGRYGLAMPWGGSD
jgi:hypothetical protein